MFLIQQQMKDQQGEGCQEEWPLHKYNIPMKETLPIEQWMKNQLILIHREEIMIWEKKISISLFFSKSRRNPFSHSDEATVRLTNGSEETEEQDWRDLFVPFGPLSCIFFAKDKTNNTSKGFAFITLNEKKGIECVCGFGSDHLILKVEWAKLVIPSHSLDHRILLTLFLFISVNPKIETSVKRKEKEIWSKKSSDFFISFLFTNEKKRVRRIFFHWQEIFFQLTKRIIIGIDRFIDGEIFFKYYSDERNEYPHIPIKSPIRTTTHQQTVLQHSLTKRKRKKERDQQQIWSVQICKRPNIFHCSFVEIDE